MDYHPRLNTRNLILTNEKIILGSFPIWALIINHLDTNILYNEKEKLIKKKGLFSFFYGNPQNQFWLWYKMFVDSGINVTQKASIVDSLTTHKIGITDVIISCERRGRSALDKHLTKRVYNHTFFRYPKENKKLKILCTSKGVLNDMLLCDMFFKEHSEIKIDKVNSEVFERSFLTKIGGNRDFLQHPVYRELPIKNGGVIQCLAIPSPGSPFRKLTSFGLDNNNSRENYLFEYLQASFQWFIES